MAPSLFFLFSRNDESVTALHLNLGCYIYYISDVNCILLFYFSRNDYDSPIKASDQHRNRPKMSGSLHTSSITLTSIFTVLIGSLGTKRKNRSDNYTAIQQW